MRPGLLRILSEWRHGHQSGDTQVGRARHSLNQRGRVLKPTTELGRFPRYADLHEDAERCDGVMACNRFQRFNQTDRVHGVDEIEVLDRVPDLVALEVADEVPPYRVKGQGSRVRDIPFTLHPPP